MDMMQLLPALMNQDNGIRAQAEEYYKTQCDSNPDTVATQLSDCIALQQVPYHVIYNPLEYMYIHHAYRM